MTNSVLVTEHDGVITFVAPGHVIKYKFKQMLQDVHYVEVLRIIHCHGLKLITKKCIEDKDKCLP